MKTLLAIILFTMLFLGCNSKPKESFVLTTGLSENPATRRIGIEMSFNQLYVCKEKNNKKGEYDFYFLTVESSYFLRLKKSIEREFNSTNKMDRVVDAKRYELIFNFNSGSDTIQFHRSDLTNKQNDILDDILGLQNLNATKIKYHKFPTTLLKHTLPKAPLAPAGAGL